MWHIKSHFPEVHKELTRGIIFNLILSGLIGFTLAGCHARPTYFIGWSGYIVFQTVNNIIQANRRTLCTTIMEICGYGLFTGATMTLSFMAGIFLNSLVRSLIT